MNGINRKKFLDSKSGLFIILNRKRSMVYIGMAKNISSKLKDYKNQLKKKCHANKKLQHHFNMDGENSFSFQCLLFGVGVNEQKRDELKQTLLDTFERAQRYNAHRTNNDVLKENILKTKQKALLLSQQPLFLVNYGIYIIRCLKTKKVYVGQSSQIKQRLTRHKNLLRRGKHSNHALQKDFLEYGENNFEFLQLLFGADKKQAERFIYEQYILETLDPAKRYNKIVNWTKRQELLNPFKKKRHSFQTKQILALKGTKQPIDFSSVRFLSKRFFFGFEKRGLYVITCWNGKHYIGQSKNVRSRLSAHKSLLKRGLHENEQLQQDFNLFGESAFQFQDLLFGTGSNRSERLKLEVMVLDTLNSKNRYNKYTNWRHRKSAQTNHNRLEKNKINLLLSQCDKTNRRKALQIDQVYYESISQASEKTGWSRSTIRRRCYDKKFPNFRMLN